MNVRKIERIEDLRAELALRRRSVESVGFVPTMGALHAGHASLIGRSAGENDLTVVSLFLNPLQFGANEDLDKYPSSEAEDLLVCAASGADIAFCPPPSELYPGGFSTYVNMDGMTAALCGKSRPDHFRGVMTVVGKLFNIVRPDRAYFGEKDAQQLAVVRKMARDLNFGTEIIGCPTVREADGLAMSSRNVYLSPDERAAATCLYRALATAGKRIDRGERDAQAITDLVSRTIGAEPLAELEYAELLDAETLESVGAETESMLLAVAARIGGTRLIDNMMFDRAKPGKNGQRS
ncbi:MAG: pantoate--beta-alanine ligase [Clostridiales Family XIII bacterium]|jgi:pantoate--beta-alanine ligase|nr:pantoate--beta-alanine ligase [Clostridiales Family XIII bacterium]